MKRNYIFTNAEGHEDLLSHKEAQAIERSGSCTLLGYINTPSKLPEHEHPVVPLMEMRTGKTEPINAQVWQVEVGPVQVVPGQHAVNWTYEELCDLMKHCAGKYALSRYEASDFAFKTQRSELAVMQQATKLKNLVLDLRLRWDGRRILRGKCARVYEWPVGWRNPKP